MLSGVTNAQRDVSDRQAEALAEAMGLDADERTYFFDLVALEQAETRARRQEALARVMARRRFRASREIVDAMYAIFERWYFAAILELVRCEGFVEDPAWIAATLRPTITAEEARGALVTLVDLGLLVRDPEGRLVPSAVSFRTDHEVERIVGLVVGRNQQWMLRRAAEAIEEFRPDERHYTTTTLAASEASLAAAKRLANHFQEELLGLAEADATPPTQVVQVSLQIMPLSVRTRG